MSQQLIDIQKQIEELKQQAEQIKQAEFQNTIEEIVNKMNAFGITLKHLTDLQPALAVALRPSKVRDTKIAKEKKAKNPVPAAYKGPNGETWSGRGLMPRWLSALVESGLPKEQFKVSQ
jgi:DNA-binding protein H-NS